MRHDVCASAELAAGDLVSVTIDSRPIVIARTKTGRLHAVADRCLHQGARLSGGRLLDDVDGDTPGEYRPAGDREVIKCPWHGYEYDLESGCVLFDRRRRLRRYRVDEHDGRITVELAAGRTPAAAVTS
jgi:nitrite reductase/ring-hydroxylating ferredoxin subunit